MQCGGRWAKMNDSIEKLKDHVARSCRILGMTGLVKEITGHVSVRIPNSEDMLIRCRGDNEFGVRFTTPDQVRRVALNGTDADLDNGTYALPLELPIHGRMLQDRPE